MKRGRKAHERTTPSGQRLYTLRTELGLTIAQAGARWGVDGTQISQYELGVTGLPVKWAISIAKMENISLDWLYGLSEDRARR